MGVFDPEAAAARPAKGSQVRAAFERLPDFVGQRTDVGALAASYADADARQVVLFELHFVDVDERLAHFDLLARSSQFVGPHAVDLLAE